MTTKRFLFCLFLSFSTLTYAQLTVDFIKMKPMFLNSITYNYAGVDQTWTVPPDVSTIWVEAYGAQGGNRDTANGGTGGLGGKVKTLLKVTPGEILYIMVGGQPSGATSVTNAVYGNGGAAGKNTTNSAKQGAAGGGMTAIFRTSVSMSNVLVVAAGGGGATISRSGGNAGELVGYVSTSDNIRGGKGGTQLAGGVIGSPTDPQIISPSSGFLGQGGAGGTISTNTWTSGGGGGAGYYGGGGGAGGGNYFGAGGGGSSYVIPTGSAGIEHFTASNLGNGKLIIYY